MRDGEREGAREGRERERERGRERERLCGFAVQKLNLGEGPQCCRKLSAAD